MQLHYRQFGEAHHPFAHQISCEFGSNLLKFEMVCENIDKWLREYGAYYRDYIYMVDMSGFTIYFSDKANAMRFKLSWSL